MPAQQFPWHLLFAILAVAGAAGLLGTSFRTLIAAFKTSVWWGLAVLFLPFAVLAFFVFNWKKQWQLFIGLVVCTGLMVGSSIAFVNAVGVEELNHRVDDILESAKSP